MPAEIDTPNRFLQWFWYKDQEKLVKSIDELVRIYYFSVGRNTNLLLGMVIDNRGLVPEKDRQIFLEFGKEIKTRFDIPIAETNGKAKELILELPRSQKINQIVIMEDISEGHLIRKYIIQGFNNNKWIMLCSGSSIGHKRIEILKPIEVVKVKLRCIETIDTPIIKNFALYSVKPLPKNQLLLKDSRGC